MISVNIPRFIFPRDMRPVGSEERQSPIIAWRRRWKHDRTQTGRRRTLESAEGYLVRECRPDCASLSVRVYAMSDASTVIRTCRTVEAAKKACEKHRRAALGISRKRGASRTDRSTRAAAAGHSRKPCLSQRS